MSPDKEAVCEVSLPPTIFGRLAVGVIERRVIECAVAWFQSDEDDDTAEQSIENLFNAIEAFVKARDQLAKDDAMPTRTLGEMLKERGAL